MTRELVYPDQRRLTGLGLTNKERWPAAGLEQLAGKEDVCRAFCLTSRQIPEARNSRDRSGFSLVLQLIVP